MIRGGKISWWRGNGVLDVLDNFHFKITFFFFFLPHPVACGVLFPLSGIEFMSPALEGGVLIIREVPFWIVSICLSRSPFPQFHFFLLWEVDLYGPRVHNIGYISDPLVVWLLVGFSQWDISRRSEGVGRVRWRYLFL